MKNIKIFSLFSVLVLVGCGQTGALYYPQETSDSSDPQETVIIHGDGSVTSVSEQSSDSKK